MKKSVVCILLLAIFWQFTFALPNYNNGNGTIVSEKTENGIKTLVRKCEREVVIGNLLAEKDRDVYTACEKKKSIGKLHDNDKVKVLRICRKDYLNELKDKYGDAKGELWYNIKSDTLEGWICIYSGYIAFLDDPYFDNGTLNETVIIGMGKLKYPRQAGNTRNECCVYDTPRYKRSSANQCGSHCYNRRTGHNRRQKRLLDKNKL